MLHWSPAAPNMHKHRHTCLDLPPTLCEICNDGSFSPEGESPNCIFPHGGNPPAPPLAKSFPNMQRKRLQIETSRTLGRILLLWGHGVMWPKSDLPYYSLTTTTAMTYVLNYLGQAPCASSHGCSFQGNVPTQSVLKLVIRSVAKSLAGKSLRTRTWEWQTDVLGGNGPTIVRQWLNMAQAQCLS
jgi:hypothetical protein